MTVNGRCHARCQWVEGHNGPHNFGPAARAAGIDAERLARITVLRGTLAQIADGRGPAAAMASARLAADDHTATRLAAEKERP